MRGRAENARGLEASPETFPSSPNIFTNPPNGNQLSVYSVSPIFPITIARGGYPRPNSSTRIPDHFATTKCPNSCTTISATITAIKIKILILYLLRYLSLFFIQNFQERLVTGVNKFLYLALQTLHFIFSYTASFLCCFKRFQGVG